MKREEGAAAIEAILFTMGDSVSVASICNALDEDLEDVRDQISYLKEKYERSDSGIGLIELEDSVQLCTKTEIYDSLIKIAKNPPKFQLTDTVLETLSIVAYKQPVTKIEIENIRGVSCDYAINKLLEFELIEELGRLPGIGGRAAES